MKKKLFYLFASLLLAGICSLAGCRSIIIEGEVCYCTFDGENPEVFKYEWMQAHNFQFCDELESDLRDKYPDHDKILCLTMKEDEVPQK